MYFSILSIPHARAKLFSEAWLILSENGLSMPLGFFSIRLAAFQACCWADPPAGERSELFPSTADLKIYHGIIRTLCNVKPDSHAHAAGGQIPNADTTCDLG